MLCFEKTQLVERERIGENIFWKQSLKEERLLYHICMKLADAKIFRPSPVGSKLREFLAFSYDCVSCFPSFFSSLPDRLMYVSLTCICSASCIISCKKKKSLRVANKKWFPCKIASGIHFWGFWGPTRGPLETHPKKLPKIAYFGYFCWKFFV